MSKVYTDRNGNSFTYVNNQRMPIGGNSNFATQNQYNKPKKRKTGCKKGTYINGDGEKRDMIRAWRPDPFAKNGFESAMAVPCHDTSFKNKGDVKGYENWVVTIQNSMGKKLWNGIYNVTKGIVSIPDLALVMSPNGQGSYGHFSSKRD